MNNLHIALIHNTLYAPTTSEIFRNVARNVSTIESSNGISHSNGASHRTAKPLKRAQPLAYPFFSFNFFSTSVCMFIGISMYW